MILFLFVFQAPQPQNETNAIAAQFAAQVAATMKIPGQTHPAQQEVPAHMIPHQPGHPSSAVVQQVHSQVVVEDNTVNNTPQPHDTVSAMPENPQSLSTSETVSEQFQNNAEPVSKDSWTNETPESSGGKSPVVNSNEPSRESSQEPVNSSANQESVVDGNIPEKVTVETTAVSEPPNTKHEEIVQTSEKQKPVVKSDEKVSSAEDAKETSETVDQKPDPKAVGEPVAGTESLGIK